MANGTDYVTLKKSGKQADFPRANLPMLKARGWTEVKADTANKVSTEDGHMDIKDLLAKIGREGTLGAASGVGIPETQHPLQDLWKNIGSQAKEGVGLKDLDPTAGALTQALGIGKELATSTGEVAEGAGADVKNPAKFGPVDVEKLSHGLGGLLSQVALLKGGEKGATTPLEESELVRGAKAIPEIPPRIVQTATGAKQTVNKLQTAAEKAAAEKTSAFEEQKAKYADEAQKAKVASRSKYEAGEEAHAQETAEVQRKHEQNVAARGKLEQENARIEQSQRMLEQEAESTSKKLTENIQKTIDTAKTAFDSEYGDFDTKILGKTAQNPKGTLQSEVKPISDAVTNAKQNLIEGTEESNKQFDSIMQRIGKDRMDLGGGQLGAVPGTMMSTADLRGYVTELESKLYDSNLLPDVRQAVKSVVEAGKKEITGSVKKQFGETAVNAYKDLNSRYSDYLTDWRDASKVNPLPRIRNILLEPVVQRNALPVHPRIAKVLTGNNAQIAAQLLNKYKQFGADPAILDRQIKTMKALDSLPKPKKLPEVKTPQFPKPSTETKFETAGRPPEAPTVEPFNRKAAMRNTMEDRLNWGGRFGQGANLLKMIYDAVHLNLGGAGSRAESAVAIEMIRRMLTSDKALNYLSREKP
jgi:hypothetical protein